MEKIAVKYLLKEVKIDKTEISRLKGNRNISHGNRLVDSLLSKDPFFLTFEDLKILIIYTLKFKDPKKRNKEKWVKNTKEYLKKYDIDSVLKEVISRDKHIKIDRDKLFNNLTIELYVEILKQIYPFSFEEKNTFLIEELCNIVVEEENKESEKIEEEYKKECVEKYHFSNILDYIFNKYSKNRTGYFPLQHPTGNGKTFFLEEFLINNLKENFESLNHDRIIVITNSKVNLNEIYRNVENKLKDDKKMKDYVLKLESINDIFNNIEFLNETINELQENLEFYQSFPPNFINNFKKELKESIKYIEQKLDPRMMDRLKEFIPQLKMKMFDYYSHEEKKELDITLPKFLSKIYPMTEKENLNKKIYIMTTDKFLYGFVGREETHYFYEEERSLIFIDEIDSSKQNFLKFIKAQRTLCAENIINVFNERINSFSSKGNNQLMSLVRRLDERAKEKKLFTKEEEEKVKREKEKLFKLFNKFVKDGKNLRNKYFTIKKYYEQEEPEKIDLFEDENNYFQNNGVIYYINVNNKNCLITKNKDKKTFDLNSLIRELFNFCYGYFNFLLVKINNYHRLFFKDGEKDIEKEIISHFFFNKTSQDQILHEYKNFFIKRLAHTKDKNQDKISEEDKIIDMKYSCFQIKEANPDYSFNKKVLISSQFMYTTPETMLLKMCTKNLVFGISATANIESCIGNFDLKFLKRNLKERFHSLTTEEKTNLKNSLEKINRFEKDITREINVFGRIGNRKIGFKNISEFEKNETILYRKVLNIVSEFSGKIPGDEKQKENQITYFEYSCMVFLNFLLEKDSRSLLFISNRLTQIPILREAFSKIKNIIKKYYEKNNWNIKDMFFKELNAKKLDENFETKDSIENDLMKYLDNSEYKTIIYTTYQSAGTGVNIKCKSKNFNRENLIGIDEEIQKVITFPLTYKDIDEIAIENKTYLLNFDEVNTKVEMLYYSTLLLENNVLSKEHRSFLLKGDIINFTGVYKKKYDYIENCMGRIIQAIGRCNRTKLRNKKRNIYMDEDSFDVAKKFEERNRLFIEDINFILSEAKRIAVEEKSVDSIVKDIISQNYKIEKSVEENFLEKISDYNNKLRFSNDNIQKENYYKEFYELVKKYNSFRKFILKNPTRERTLIKNPAYFSIREKLSGYNVIRNDWNSIKNISFDSVYNNVSFNDSRIKEISEIPLLKNFCSENIGTFVENEEIILPYIYQAIFKGMLGEVIIKEIFRMYRIKLKDIDFMIKRGIFEKFDDITENGIYIDYKNYNLDKIDSRDFFNEIIEDSVLRKEELINSKNKLFIINLIAEKGDSKALYCYKISDLFNDINKICDYNESEVVIINGVLRYKDNKSILEINENLLRKLQKILGGNDE